MKQIKKMLAIVCTITLLLSLVGVNDYKTKAADYSALSYKEISNNGNSEFNQKLKGAKYAIVSGSTNIAIIQFQNQAYGELYIADGGWGADQLTAKINGISVTVEGAGIRIMNAANVLTKRYNELTITWNGGEALVVIYCPEIAEEESSASSENTSNSGETVSNSESTSGSGEITTNAGSIEMTTTAGSAEGTTAGVSETTSLPEASSLPKKAEGLNPQVKTDQYTIDNAVLLAWASVMEKANPNYDASVYTYNLYIYKDGTQISKVCNVTNGCILGGLSSGSYGFAIAAVNAMGEGPKSDTATVTITGCVLDYTPKAEYNGPKIPDGCSITSADETYKANVPKENQINTLQVAWAASDSTSDSPGYDTSVIGYNVYVFDAETGKPYRRVYKDGIKTNTAIIKNVSAGKYVCFVTAVSATGESGMAAPGLSLPSSVEIEGDVLDNAQDFSYPDQPDLPVGMVINEIDNNGFSIAWSRDADLSGIRINVFVDGICIKAGANGGADPTYHETRLTPGTYEVAVTAQFISNNVESVPMTATVKVGGNGTNTPEQIKDTSYSAYVHEVTTEAGNNETTTQSEITTAENNTGEITSGTEESSSEVTTNENGETITSGGEITTGISGGEQTTAETPSNVNPTVTPSTTASGGSDIQTTAAPVKIIVGKTAVKKASKKKSAKKAKVVLKKVSGATKYQIKYGIGKKMKKVKTKTVKSINVTLKKLKAKKVYYVKARALKVVKGNGSETTYYGTWSKAKKIKMK